MKIVKPKPVTPSRRLAQEVLRRVDVEGAFATLALNHALERSPNMSAEDRALTTELVYGTIRWRRMLDYALAAHSHRPLERMDQTLLRILRMTVYQLLFLDRVPVWAAVDEGTKMATLLRGNHAAGFVNGVLRGLAGAKDRIEWPDREQNLIHSLGVRHSFPDWMVEWWVKLFGVERAESFMQASNRPGLFWVRTNTLRMAVDGLVNLLSASGLQCKSSEIVPGAVLVEGAADVRSLVAHEAGLFHVQEAAAQAVCHLLDPRPGQRVLDTCAAPGGKTATMAELMGDEGEILAVDVHPARLGLVRKLLDRLGIGCVRTAAADLSQSVPEEWGLFDRVLLDAPCSGLGVLRRHPESKWRTPPDDIARLAKVQRELMDSVAKVVKPGGYLVYSVCTFTEEEGAGQIRSWLAEHPEFEILDPKQGKKSSWKSLIDADGFMRTWPDIHDMDAFFAVRLRKKET
jgi:16S rRNA (cytosine967-C5)-methyltransferase